MKIDIFAVVVWVVVFVALYRFFYNKGIKQGEKQILEKICRPYETTTGVIVDYNGGEYDFSTTFKTQHITLPTPEEEKKY